MYILVCSSANEVSSWKLINGPTIRRCRLSLKAARCVRLVFYPAKRSTHASIFDIQLKTHPENIELSSILLSIPPLVCSGCATALSQSVTSSEWSTLQNPHIVTISSTVCPCAPPLPSGRSHSSQSGTNRGSFCYG